MIVVVVGLVAGLGILGVLAIYGVRKYVANAKTAEARHALAQIGKDAAIAFEGERDRDRAGPSLPLGGAGPARLRPRERPKYMSVSSEWTANSGWSCLHFEMSSPQYYQYRYDGFGSGFRAIAEGDSERQRHPIEVRVGGAGRVRRPPALPVDPGDQSGGVDGRTGAMIATKSRMRAS